jgi:class 3 adenylate cyclase
MLTERRKELACIYRVCAMHNRFEESLQSYFNELIVIMCDSWQHPKVTCVKIIHQDQVYASENYKSTPWQQVSNIKDGKIVVGYVSEQTEVPGGEGPFLIEERHLLDGLCRIVSDFLTTRGLRRDLNERYKELGCLYRISQAMVKEDLKLDSFFRQVVDDIVPRSFQFPHQTAVKLSISLSSDVSDSVVEYSNQLYDHYSMLRSMKSPIPLPRSTVTATAASPVSKRKKTVELTGVRYIGYIEIGYVSGASQNLMFLPEEQKLIDAIAEQMGACVAKIKRDQLVHSMLPPKVALDIELGNKPVPEEYKVVSIMFCDIVGFTDMSSKCTPVAICEMLDKLYKRFDNIVKKSDDMLYKVETIGDAYMVVSGLPTVINGSDTAIAAVHCGLKFIDATDGIFAISKTGSKLNVEIRVGVHSGPVVAGVVGQLMPRYCLFGDTVNTASRMESMSEANKVNVAQKTFDLIQQALNEWKTGGGFTKEDNTSTSTITLNDWKRTIAAAHTTLIEDRGKHFVKGKGDMHMYFYSAATAHLNDEDNC